MKDDDVVYCDWHFLGPDDTSVRIDDDNPVDSMKAAALMTMAMRGIIHSYVGMIAKDRMDMHPLLFRVKVVEGRLKATDAIGVFRDKGIQHVQGILDRMMALPDYKDILLRTRLEAL